MQYDIRYQPAFSTLFVTLNPGEQITAEAGAMASMDNQLTMKTEFNGGFFQALLKAFLGGESLFVNHFRNDSGRPLGVVFTQAIVGDMACEELKNQELCFQPGAYIAHTGQLKLGVQWAGFSSFFAGEGLFRLKIAGTGLVFFGAYGGITSKMVDGEFIVDSDHLVAYEPQLQLKIGLAGGLVGSVTSGEGLVSRMQGRGKIYMQSRSVSGLVRFIRPKL